jgi:hypothetical protein
MADGPEIPEERKYQITRRQILAGAGFVVGAVIFGMPAGVALDRYYAAKVPSRVRPIIPHWTDHGGVTTIPWVYFAGDPRAKADQSTWKMIGVVAARETEIQDLEQLTEGSIPAAAFRVNDQTARATELGSLYNLAKLKGDNDETLRGVGMLIGPGVLAASVGVLNPDGRFIGAQTGRDYGQYNLSTIVGVTPSIPVVKA